MSENIDILSSGQHAQAPAQHRCAQLLRVGIALYAAVLILAVYPYSSLPAVDIKILATHVASLVLLALYVFCAWRKRLPASPPRLLLGPMAAFVIVNAIAALASPHPANALVMTARYFSFAVLYFVTASTFNSMRHVSRLLVVIVLAVAVSSVYGFCQRAGIDPLPWNTSLASQEHLKHMASTYGNPNLAGHVLIIAVLYSAYLVTGRRTRWVIVLLPLLLVHLASAGLRAGWGALGMAVLFVVVAWRVRLKSYDFARGTRATILRFTLAASVLGVMGAAGIAFHSGFRAPADSSLLLRCNSFYSGARMVVDNPLLGFGPDNYRILNVRYWTPYEQEHFARDRLENDHPHNEFLFAAISAGIPGLLLYIAILARALVGGLSLYLSDSGADLRRFGLASAAFAIVFAVDGMFGFNVAAPASGALLFLMLGALDGVYTAGESPRTVQAWRFRAAASCCMVIALACSVLGAACFAGQVYLARGQSAMYWKAYSAAGEQFGRAGFVLPWDWMPGYYAAKAHLAQGDVTGALNSTVVSLERNPQYVPSLLDAAFMEFNLAATEPVTASPDVLDAARAYARQAQALCPPVPEANDVLGRAALLEAERMRLRGAQDADGYRQLVLEAEDRFSRAIICGAENVSELSELAAAARAMSDPSSQQGHAR